MIDKHTALKALIQSIENANEELYARDPCVTRVASKVGESLAYAKMLDAFIKQDADKVAINLEEEISRLKKR